MTKNHNKFNVSKVHCKGDDNVENKKGYSLLRYKSIEALHDQCTAEELERGRIKQFSFALDAKSRNSAEKLANAITKHQETAQDWLRKKNMRLIRMITQLSSWNTPAGHDSEIVITILYEPT